MAVESKNSFPIKLDLKQVLQRILSRINQLSLRLRVLMISIGRRYMSSKRKFTYIIFSFGILIIFTLVIMVFTSNARNTPTNECRKLYTTYNDKTFDFATLPQVTGKVSIHIIPTSCEGIFSYVTTINAIFEPNKKFKNNPYIGYFVEHKILNDNNDRIGLTELKPMYQNENKKLIFSPTDYDSLSQKADAFYQNEKKRSDVSNDFYAVYVLKRKLTSNDDIEKLLANNILSIWDGRDFVYTNSNDKNVPILDITQAYKDAPKIHEYSIVFTK